MHTVVLDLLLASETWKMIKGADRAVDMFCNLSVYEE